MKPYTVVLLVPVDVCAAFGEEPYGTEVYAAQVQAPDWPHAIDAAQVEAHKVQQKELAEMGAELDRDVHIHPEDYKMIVGFEGHGPLQFGWQWR